MFVRTIALREGAYILQGLTEITVDEAQVLEDGYLLSEVVLKQMQIVLVRTKSHMAAGIVAGV